MPNELSSKGGELGGGVCGAVVGKGMGEGSRGQGSGRWVGGAGVELWVGGGLIAGKIFWLVFCRVETGKVFHLKMFHVEQIFSGGENRAGEKWGRGPGRQFWGQGQIPGFGLVSLSTEIQVRKQLWGQACTRVRW